MNQAGSVLHSIRFFSGREEFGSASELEYHLLLARDLHLIQRHDYDDLARRTTEVKRMLSGLFQKLAAAITLFSPRLQFGCGYAALWGSASALQPPFWAAWPRDEIAGFWMVVQSRPRYAGLKSGGAATLVADGSFFISPCEPGRFGGGSASALQPPFWAAWPR